MIQIWDRYQVMSDSPLLSDTAMGIQQGALRTRHCLHWVQSQRWAADRHSRKLEQVLSSPAPPPPPLHLISAGQPAVKPHIVPWPQKTHVSCLFALKPRCRARLSPARLGPARSSLSGP